MQLSVDNNESHYARSPITLEQKVADHDCPSRTGYPGLAVANDGDADGLAGLVLLDLGQQLLDGLHPLVLDGDDQVGRVGIEVPADEAQARAALPAPGPAGCRPARRDLPRPSP